MKLIIDIPNELAEKGHWYTDKEIWTVIRAAHNGIPLDKIRDEIRQTVDEEQKHDGKWAIGLRYALKIIDTYMKGE